MNHRFSSIGSLSHAAAIAGLFLSAGLLPADDRTDFFESRIRPVLVRECIGCHGEKDPESGLSLHTRQGLLLGGEQGPAIVPGDVEESLLLAAIEHRDGMRMPPKGKRLDKSVIDDIRKWVKEGAVYPESLKRVGDEIASIATHWAFRPIDDKAAGDFGENDPNLIDFWVDKAIREKALPTTRPAARRTLLRRATIALHGLPPTPEEVDAFLKDPGTDDLAFAAQIERLLASPRFGERWARHWLDLARYSDTKGYVFFEENDFPWSFGYRDYVIRSFADDKPYDRFVREQIAADQMPESTQSPESLAALGFLTLGNRYLNNPHDIIDDRIDVVTRPLMGLSVTCARCHDHKFDPILARDYYGLYGIFANSVEPLLPPPLNPSSRNLQSIAAERQITEKHANLKSFVDAKYDELTDVARRRSGDYLLAAEQSRKAPKTDDFMLIADGGDLNPSMILRWRSFIDESRKRNFPVMRLWNAMADVTSTDFASTLAERMRDEANPLLKAKILERNPDRIDALAEAYGAAFRSAFGVWKEFRERIVASGRPVPAIHPDTAVEELRRVLDGPQSPTRIARNPQGDLTLLPDRASQAELRKRISEFEESRRAPHAAIRPQMLQDRENIEDYRVFVRGNPQNEGESAPRGFLSMFEPRLPGRPIPSDQSGRLQLAEAITDPSNPLTARVYVNRVWSVLFGQGLVSTPGDFGTRGEPPSHPELLDALASDFVRSGWSTKRLVRRIMMSRAFRRSTLGSDDASARSADVQNRFLSNFPVRRTDFETMRDSLLFVSGLLDTRSGGPADGQSTDPKFRRRTIYGKIDRLNLAEQFRVFDFPDPNASAAERSITTTPGQSLYLMNHPLMRSCAEGLANRVRSMGAADDLDAARLMARIVWQRSLTADETAEIVEFLKVADTDPGERRTALAQSFLMSNEFHFTD
jgi:mono/diheme cytochrome c family protein